MKFVTPSKFTASTSERNASFVTLAPALRTWHHLAQTEHGERIDTRIDAGQYGQRLGSLSVRKPGSWNVV